MPTILELTTHRNESILTDERVKRTVLLALFLLGGGVSEGLGVAEWYISVPIIAFGMSVVYMATRSRFIGCDASGLILRLNPWRTQTIGWNEVRSLSILPNDLWIRASKDRDIMVELYGTSGDQKSAFVEALRETTKSKGIAYEEVA